MRSSEPEFALHERWKCIRKRTDEAVMKHFGEQVITTEHHSTYSLRSEVGIIKMWSQDLMGMVIEHEERGEFDFDLFNGREFVMAIMAKAKTIKFGTMANAESGVVTRFHITQNPGRMESVPFRVVLKGNALIKRMDIATTERN